MQNIAPQVSSSTAGGSNLTGAVQSSVVLQYVPGNLQFQQSIALPLSLVYYGNPNPPMFVGQIDQGIFQRNFMYYAQGISIYDTSIWDTSGQIFSIYGVLTLKKTYLSPLSNPRLLVYWTLGNDTPHVLASIPIT